MVWDRDGISVKNSTDEYFSQKKQHKKRVCHDILEFAPKQREFPELNHVAKYIYSPHPKYCS